MHFSVLGPLEVLDRDGVAVVVRGSKVRTVLAMLVMGAGEPVTTGQLCWLHPARRSGGGSRDAP